MNIPFKFLPHFLLTSVFALIVPRVVFAQNDDKQVSLGEVVVKARRVVNKDDGLIIYPTEEQRKASGNVYGVLQRLSLPNIRVTENSVSAIDARGYVQVRINGIMADVSDMKSIDPRDVIRVRFIDNPGVRYGEGISYVIDIMTRRNDMGYAAGMEVNQGINRKHGSYMTYGKWNYRLSELSLSYDFGFMDNDKMRRTENADYHLTDGSVYNITRTDIEKRRRSFDNNVKLKYNYSDSANNVFQAALSASFSNSPHDYVHTDVTDGVRNYISNTFEKNKAISPVLDIYYSHQITQRQNITMNAVGTMISTDAFYSNDEGGLYQYVTDGRTYSLLSEIIYENRLKPFTLSAGINYKQKYTDNQYKGSFQTANAMHDSRTQMFTELRGHLGHLSYTAGVRASYLNNRQGGYKYNDWFFSPKLTLSYDFTPGLQFRYDFYSEDRASNIAMKGDAMIRQNSMEWIKGSPDLKSNRDIYNIARLSYNTDRLQTFGEMFFKQCIHPNMEVYERTPDDEFIRTQRNQKKIEVINAMAYVNYWLIPSKLSVMAYGGLFRCFNFGDDYTHCYTSYFGSANINAYLGSLSLSAYIDFGSRHVEGETKGYSAGSANLQASYTLDRWNLSLKWDQPFSSKRRLFQSEILNRNLQKVNTLRSSFDTNALSMTISYRFTSGRKYKAAKKTINLHDNDTGIMSN